ncbi:hypothetical protein [Natronorubrum bangense]|uniref:Uncharacterized protein n=1 Tax=Natronorubrum bangense JCM 10635 TaxID=1227500 RepID=L9W3K6_9EURY|nr:hypothetical protein C494_18003 [Natronorubrum bangense JCM 10635]
MRSDSKGLERRDGDEQVYDVSAEDDDAETVAAKADVPTRNVIRRIESGARDIVRS